MSQQSPSQNSKATWLLVLLAFLAGIALAALSLSMMKGKKNAAAPSENSNQEAAASESTTVVASVGKDIDYDKVFPSWNSDSASLKELVDFVADSTDQSNPDYIELEDRIATFDMDGTILCSPCMAASKVPSSILSVPFVHAVPAVSEPMLKI